MRTASHRILPLSAATVAAGLLASTSPAHAQASPPSLVTVQAPAWAYPVSGPLPPLTEVPDAQVPQRLPGTTAAYTKAQLRNLYAAPDWRPEPDRAQMPPIVAQGRNPGVFACGYCHLPTGTGRPENANLTGLTAAYITQQLADFKSGARKSTVAAMLPQAIMVRNAKNATDAEIEAAARWFAALPARSLVAVVEAARVPHSEPRGWMLVPAVGTGHGSTGPAGRAAVSEVTAELSAEQVTEPIGERIVELPGDVRAVELRDPAAGFVAYVPPGSIERGRRLAADASRGAACTTCHGTELKGLADIPRLAGRSPSYLVRQLVDFATGARNGASAAPMVEVAKSLSEADRVALAAYAASLAP